MGKEMCLRTTLNPTSDGEENLAHFRLTKSFEKQNVF